MTIIVSMHQIEACSGISYPFQSRGKTGTASASEAGSFDLRNNLNHNISNNSVSASLEIEDGPNHGPSVEFPWSYTNRHTSWHSSSPLHGVRKGSGISYPDPSALHMSSSVHPLGR
jgi:hypothetical protein